MTEIIDDFSKGSPYRFLSNFWPDEEGAVSVEHLFQAAKTLDPKEKHEIMFALTPGKAKRLGRKATLREDWDEVKDQIMLDYLRIKFGQSTEPIRHWLQDTRDAVLIEGNKHGDTYWGATRTANRSLAEWRGNYGIVWYGKNMLGILLMQVRQEIKEGKL